MSQIVEAAKAEFTRAQNRITRALKSTPEDKVNWSPSPTARTPIQLVAHAAMGTQAICGMMQGKPMPGMSNIAEMDAAMRVGEKEFTTPEQALELLDKTSTDFLTWLDTLTDEQVAATMNFPFGPQPMAAAITFPADHLRCHSSQIEYLQTVWGDHAWNM